MNKNDQQFMAQKIRTQYMEKEQKSTDLDKLKELDAVAYVRFASVYREFKDVNTFMSELKKLLDSK